MFRLYDFLLATTFFLGASNTVYSQKGILVVSANFAKPDGSMQQLIPDDSLFCSNDWILERNDAVLISQVDNSGSERSSILKGFFWINFRKNIFYESKNLQFPKGSVPKTLKEKNQGYLFDLDKVIIGSNPIITKAILNHEQSRKVKYKITSGPYKGKDVIMYFRSNFQPGRPVVLAPLLERRFQGNLMQVEIPYEAGNFIIIHSFIKHIPHKYFKAIKSIK